MPSELPHPQSSFTPEPSLNPIPCFLSASQGPLFASLISVGNMENSPASAILLLELPSHTCASQALHTQAGDTVCVQHLVLGTGTLAAPGSGEAQAAAASIIHPAFVGTHCRRGQEKDEAAESGKEKHTK